ncbi:unnamed protein product, partial [Medioppia subpectinata]
SESERIISGSRPVVDPIVAIISSNDLKVKFDPTFGDIELFEGMAVSEEPYKHIQDFELRQTVVNTGYRWTVNHLKTRDSGSQTSPLIGKYGFIEINVLQQKVRNSVSSLSLTRIANRNALLFGLRTSECHRRHTRLATSRCLHSSPRNIFSSISSGNSFNDFIRRRHRRTTAYDRKGVKRRRDADQRILDQFWVICDPNDTKRNKSLKLIVEILVKQNDTNGSNDVMYCLDRVIRGMASARQFARHGFCVLLTQLLMTFEEKISLEVVFELSEKHLQKIKDVSNHDSVIGWSLVMASVIKSGRLKADTSEDVWDMAFNVLYSLGMSKQYIELVVCDLFTQFMALLNKKALFDKIVWTRLETDLKTANRFKPFFIFKYCEKRGEINFIVKSDELHRLSLIIKESTAYQPLVHPMNKQIVKHFLTNKTDFTKFWSTCVEVQIRLSLEALFTPNQIEKGSLGFELIKICFPLITSKDTVSSVLSPPFLRLFIQSLSVKSHPLHTSAQQLCQFFIEFTKNVENSELQLEILNSKSIKKWTQKLRDIFLTTTKVDSNDLFRNRCIQQISDVCRSIASVDDIETLWSNIRFLFIYSYFDVNEGLESTNDDIRKPAVPISESLRNTLRHSFRSAFNHMTHLGSKTTKERLLTEVQILSSMLEFISDPFKTIAKKVSKLNKKLKSNCEKENEIRIFVLLYSMVAIQLFEEFEDIDDVLKDLNECMKRAIDGQEEEESGEDSPVWADHICGHITNSGVNYLVDAINPSNDNKLFDGNIDSDEGEDEEEDEEEENKSESDSESESEEENQTGEVDEKFRNDVINALGAAAENDDEEESIYLSDSEMFQIDETLAAVFKSKFANKKELNEKQNSILMFRTRCLELIQIYLNSKSVNMDQIVRLIQPIVSVAKSSYQPSKQNQLSSKAVQLIIQISKIKDKTDESLVVNDLKQLLDNYLELQRALNSLFIWTIQMSKRFFPQDYWYIEVIENGLQVFFKKNNSQINDNLFKTLIVVHNEIGFKLFDVFIDYAFREEIRAFKKSVAIEVLLTLCKTQNSKHKTIDISDDHLSEVRQKCLTVLCSELNNEKLKSQYISELLRLYDLCDKQLKDRKADQKISHNEIQDLSTKLKSLSKQKKKCMERMTLDGQGLNEKTKKWWREY